MRKQGQKPYHYWISNSNGMTSASEDGAHRRVATNEGGVHNDGWITVVTIGTGQAAAVGTG